MNKVVISSLLVVSLSASAIGFLPKDGGRMSFADAMHNRYCSPEALEEQLDHLKSPEERQLVAAWLQLELLRAPDATFEKFTSSKQWKARTLHVTLLIKRLSLDDSGLASLHVYQRCFETISDDNKVVPGFEDKPRKLMQPSMLARRVFRY
jgi:hypothetical protein